MKFQAAYSYMKHGYEMKLPEWGGYWYWNKATESIVIHTREGKDLDIRETEDVDYTIGFMFRDDWEFRLMDKSNDDFNGPEAIESDE